MKKKNSGGYSGGVTPVPIPNTVVKSSSAHGTRFSWESGSLPVFFILYCLFMEPDTGSIFFVIINLKFNRLQVKHCEKIYQGFQRLFNP